MGVLEGESLKFNINSMFSENSSVFNLLTTWLNFVPNKLLNVTVKFYKHNFVKSSDVSNKMSIHSISETTLQCCIFQLYTKNIIYATVL